MFKLAFRRNPACKIHESNMLSKMNYTRCVCVCLIRSLDYVWRITHTLTRSLTSSLFLLRVFFRWKTFFVTLFLYFVCNESTRSTTITIRTRAYSDWAFAHKIKWNRSHRIAFHGMTASSVTSKLYEVEQKKIVAKKSIRTTLHSVSFTRIHKA